MMRFWRSLQFGVRVIALKRMATLPLAAILRIQRRRLKALVQYAREQSDFYGEKYADVDADNFELEDIPTTNKMELMENLERAFTTGELHRDELASFFEDEENVGKAFRERFALSHTSGSQGQPLVIAQPLENLELLYALQASRGNHQDVNVSVVAEHLVAPARIAAVTLKAGFYPSASAIQFVPEVARQFINVQQFSSTDVDLIARLNEFRPTHLTSYTSVLHGLARAVEAGELNLKPELQQVVNISERLIPQTRKHYTEVFGTPLLDDYAMGECLFLSNGCPTSGGMHVNADWSILEVVDDENRPVPAGAKGAKVLVTNLANWAQPFIRYEVGDIVTMADKPCGCGSNMPLIERVDGRDSDVFRIPSSNGLKELSPIVFEHALAHVVDAREYQIVQEAATDFRIRVEPLPGKELDTEQAHQAIQKHLVTYGLKDKIRVEVELVDELTSDGEQKFKRVVSQIDDSVEPKRKSPTAA